MPDLAHVKIDMCSANQRHREDVGFQTITVTMSK